jgi:hypothetical protein
MEQERWEMFIVVAPNKQILFALQDFLSMTQHSQQE